MQFVSLGNYCAVAYQIRRFANAHDSFFFDWLITGRESIKAITMDPDQFFLPGNWWIEDRVRVIDKATGLKFQHEFEVDPRQIERVGNYDVPVIHEERVERQLARARQKFSFLQQKTIAAITNGAVVVRQQDDIGSSAEALELAAEIKRTFSKLNDKLTVIVVSARMQDEFLSGDCGAFNVQSSPRWEGDNRSWDRILAFVAHRSALAKP